MAPKDDNLHNLLSRTPLATSFDQIIPDIEKQYPSLGKITSYHPINEGYEDANILLTSDSGKYVIKMFLSERTDETIADYIKIILESTRLGIITTQLVKRTNGYLGMIGSAKFIITEFFQGESFKNITPSISDMVAGVRYIAKLNTLSFPIHETYDSWGNKNLIKEHKLLRHKLSSAQLGMIYPIIEEFKLLDFSQFSNAVIHGDMQRKHLLKNSLGEYCMLDFGCMAYGPKIIELSTYLAWFCLAKDTWDDVAHIYQIILDEYCIVHKRSAYEISAIKPLFKASWAAYYQKTAELIHEGDTSEETMEWHHNSEAMLKLASSW